MSFFLSCSGAPSFAPPKMSFGWTAQLFQKSFTTIPLPRCPSGLFEKCQLPQSGESSLDYPSGPGITGRKFQFNLLWQIIRINKKMQHTVLKPVFRFHFACFFLEKIALQLTCAKCIWSLVFFFIAVQ